MGTRQALRELRRAIGQIRVKDIGEHAAAVVAAMGGADKALAVKPKPKCVESATPTERAVVICTDKRGVFFGYATDTTGDSIVLTRPRMCVYWDQATRGVLGLAATGPTKGCRITQAPPRIELRGITCVIECDKAAVAAWEASPWQA